MFGTKQEALEHAAEMADRTGASMCIVSGSKKGATVFRVYPLKGFGLPPGGKLEKVVEPKTERPPLEPREKTSTNGF